MGSSQRRKYKRHLTIPLLIREMEVYYGEVTLGTVVLIIVDRAHSIPRGFLLKSLCCIETIFIKIQSAWGAPGWLGRLCVWHPLRSRSPSLQVLCCRRVAYFGSSVSLSLSAPPLSHTHTLSKTNVFVKKERSLGGKKEGRGEESHLCSAFSLRLF